MVQLVAQVPRELKEEAERLAAAERRSVSNWLRNLVTDRIEAAKSQQAAA
jgi:molybdopterin-guanine dinucleotide biosynthesis protein A